MKLLIFTLIQLVAQMSSTVSNADMVYVNFAKRTTTIRHQSPALALCMAGQLQQPRHLRLSRHLSRHEWEISVVMAGPWPAVIQRKARFDYRLDHKDRPPLGGGDVAVADTLIIPTCVQCAACSVSITKILAADLFNAVQLPLWEPQL